MKEEMSFEDWLMLEDIKTNHDGTFYIRSESRYVDLTFLINRFTSLPPKPPKSRIVNNNSPIAKTKEICCVCETRKANTGHDMMFCKECWSEED